MTSNKFSIKNRKLAFNQSLEFIKFLRRNYPTSPVTITFQHDAIYTLRVEGCDVICRFKGACPGNQVIISVIETNPEEQLRLIAHEYRHAWQYNQGLYPDSEAHIFTAGGVLIKCHGEAEQDSREFEKYAVQEFLQERAREVDHEALLHTDNQIRFFNLSQYHDPEADGC